MPNHVKPRAQIPVEYLPNRNSPLFTRIWKGIHAPNHTRGPSKLQHSDTSGIDRPPSHRREVASEKQQPNCCAFHAVVIRSKSLFSPFAMAFPKASKIEHFQKDAPVNINRFAQWENSPSNLHAASPPAIDPCDLEDALKATTAEPELTQTEVESLGLTRATANGSLPRVQFGIAVLSSLQTRNHFASKWKGWIR
jgi:hypothetical protein